MPTIVGRRIVKHIEEQTVYVVAFERFGKHFHALLPVPATIDTGLIETVIGRGRTVGFFEEPLRMRVEGFLVGLAEIEATDNPDVPRMRLGQHLAESVVILGDVGTHVVILDTARIVCRDSAHGHEQNVPIVIGDLAYELPGVERRVGLGKIRLNPPNRLGHPPTPEFLRTDPGGFKQIYSCDVFETCFPVHFHKDGKRVYIMTNNATGNLVRLALLDVATGKEVLVESDPKNRVDLGNAQFSDLTDKLLATVYEDEKPRLYFRDKSIESDYKLIRSKLGGKEITPVSKTKDERLWLVSAWGDTEPGETYLFSSETKKLMLQYRVREKLPRENLTKMEPIRYESSDGKEIPAYLTLPNGMTPKNLPLVVFPHGGPWGRDVWRYNTFAQFLANRGYAVLQPNFRASIGYGKNFLNARQRPVGPQNAGRYHLGSQVSCRQRHCRPETYRHHGHLLRRLRDTGWRRFHARFVLCSRGDRRPREPDDAPRYHPDLAPRRNLSATAAQLVCEYRQGVCAQSRRRGGAISEPAVQRCGTERG
jgi:hypothetical protein